jgi:ketosteroid isomerase-like protein
MKIDSLKSNTLSPAAFEWYLGYLAAMDSGDVAHITAKLDEDCAVQINNHLPLHGRAAITAAFDRYWDAIDKIEHELLNIYGRDDQFAVEMLCHYTRKDGSVVTLPAAVFIDRGADGRITYARSYIDATPVHDAFTRRYA